MDTDQRIQRSIERALAIGFDPAETPPKLGAAVRHAVLPGGSRLRPRLCLAVAGACGDPAPAVTEAAAAALELLHCASLVHDDLPCFDDAATRRGRPSVQHAYGEPLAVLAGDALIVLSFEQLADSVAGRPDRLAPLVSLLSSSIGMARGLCAGQGWECEPEVNVSTYHRAKTGALFSAATAAGAIAAGADPLAWRTLGARLGEAYQVADDLHDVAGDAAAMGKPAQRDAALGRPNAVHELGTAGAVARLKQLVEEAVCSIPPCPGAPILSREIAAQAAAFLPPEISQRVA